MIVKVSTELETTPDRAWLAVKRPETLQYVTRGVLGFRPLGELPQVLGEGAAVRVRLFFFHVLPAWSHEIRIVRVAEAEREIFTNERGGPVRSWNHRIEISPVADDAGRCRYSDEIEVRAGALTPLVWLYAQLFYRYRQRRWRRLARSLRD